MSNQYGLILSDKKDGSKKPTPTFAANRNVFGDDSDSDDNVKASSIPVSTGEKSKRQAKAVQDKVLEEDPTVYQYDELYEDISSEKNKRKQLGKVAVEGAVEERKPKYIEKLLYAAERRKKENERRVERQIQKEREEEGDKFADKEAFVTSAYKKKLEELREEEEREQREKYLEDIGDVTKQSDLGGFYRHLYEQQLRPEIQRPDIYKKVTTDEQNSSENTKQNQENSIESGEEEKRIKKNINKDKRSYRKRKSSVHEKDDSTDEEVNRKAVHHKKSGKQSKVDCVNPDADSDFSIDESSSGSEDEANKINKKNANETKEVKVEKNNEIEVQSNKDANHKFKIPNQVPANSDKTVREDKTVMVEEVKHKIDIWKKRTVGEVFEQALQRYYARKAARSC